MDGFSNHTTAYHQAMSFFWYTKNIKDAREWCVWKHGYETTSGANVILIVLSLKFICKC
jgi:hypothetical protein